LKQVDEYLRKRGCLKSIFLENNGITQFSKAIINNSKLNSELKPVLAAYERKGVLAKKGLNSD